jgi:hypothetical protein
VSNLKTAEPGQSMKQALTAPPRSSDGSTNYQKPENLQQVLAQAAELRSRGITPPTFFVAAPGKIGLKDGTPFMDEAAATGATVAHYSDLGAREAPPVDTLVMRGQALGQQRFRETIVVNRTDASADKADFGKALEIEKVAVGTGQ